MPLTELDVWNKHNIATDHAMTFISKAILVPKIAPFDHLCVANVFERHIDLLLRVQLNCPALYLALYYDT
jgi:hypothetical protein